MEFTKKNVIALLTDAKEIFTKLSRDNKEEANSLSESFSKAYYEGRSSALDSCANYLGDLIFWVEDYMKETSDYMEAKDF